MGLTFELGEAGFAGAGAVSGLDVGVDAGGHGYLDGDVGGGDVYVRDAEVAWAKAVTRPATPQEAHHSLLRDDELRLALAHQREGRATDQALVLEREEA